MKVTKRVENRLFQQSVEHWIFEDDNGLKTTFSYIRESFDSLRFAGVVLYEDFEDTDFTATVKWSSAWQGAELAEQGNVTSEFMGLLDGYLFDVSRIRPRVVTQDDWMAIHAAEYVENIVLLHARDEPKLALGLFRQNSEITFAYRPRITRGTSFHPLGRFHI